MTKAELESANESLLKKLAAAEEMIRALDDLLACYRLRKSRVRAIDRVIRARKEWEEQNDKEDGDL